MFLPSLGWAQAAYTHTSHVLLLKLLKYLSLFLLPAALPAAPNSMKALVAVSPAVLKDILS